MVADAMAVVVGLLEVVSWLICHPTPKRAPAPTRTPATNVHSSQRLTRLRSSFARRPSQS